MIRLLLTTALLADSTIVPPTPGTLSPSGRWTVKYADDLCVLQRDYGSGEALVTLGFRPLPLSVDNQVVLVTSRRSDRKWGTLADKVSLRLGATGPIITGSYLSWRSDATPDLRYTLLDLVDATVEKITAPDTLTIEREKLPAVSLHPMMTPDALAALATCQDELLQRWGVDLAEKALIVTPAVADNIAQWVTDADYPIPAIQRQIAGSVSIIWTITTDGRVTDCRMLQSSGNALLDQAACSAITRRGKYKPALDASGKPIRSHDSRRIVWSL